MSKSEQRRFQEQMMRVQLNRQKNKENKESGKNINIEKEQKTNH